jgi:hypothetical protein
MRERIKEASPSFRIGRYEMEAEAKAGGSI